ncbi:hypothetical protein CFC21_099308 [Triticum aestivum]|uniref:NTF2 domain-containing protein n=2 Tax=Triticum aestivum TaxID=4565 RepID=A0A9R1N1Q1_WHEAT|nr:hypothetical protein CFC21_099308 [Triticum aestivum]
MAAKAGNSVGGVLPHPHVDWFCLQIGNVFAQHYYKILNESPEDVHKFYHDQSILGRKPNSDGTLTSITTLRDINKHFVSTYLKGCSMEIDNVDSQPSHEGGVLVLVSGSFTVPDAMKRRFTQSFFLAPQKGGYFVLNDVLRYIPVEPESTSISNEVMNDR